MLFAREFLVLVLVCGNLFGQIQARLGVDLSVPTTADDWTCLTNEHNVSYAIIRAYRSLGAIDTNAAPSLRLAAEAGVSDLGAYMFPCLTSSSYAKSKGIICDAPEVQVLKTVKYFLDNNIHLKHSATMEDDVRVTPVYVNRIWIDVEDEDPPLYYDADPKVNQAFLARMVAQLNKMRIPLGIYTKTNYWSIITANATGYTQYPLWYPRYDATDSLDFFVPFGGWESVHIKQTGGDVGYCGLTQVDSDYML